MRRIGGRGDSLYLKCSPLSAVLAILIGILSPAIRAMRQKAEGIVSMTRQKEVASGLLEYATDFSDRLPQSVATIGTGEYWNWTEPMMLTGYRERSPGLHRSMAEYLRDYIPDPRVLSCPSAPGRIRIWSRRGRRETHGTIRVRRRFRTR